MYIFTGQTTNCVTDRQITAGPFEYSLA